jgi:hypothetical protein
MVSIVITEPAAVGPEHGFEQQLNESVAVFSHELLHSSPAVQISPPSCAQDFMSVAGATVFPAGIPAAVVTGE